MPAGSIGGIRVLLIIEASPANEAPRSPAEAGRGIKKRGAVSVSHTPLLVFVFLTSQIHPAVFSEARS